MNDAQEARSQFIQSFLTWSAYVCGYFIFFGFTFLGLPAAASCGRPYTLTTNRKKRDFSHHVGALAMILPTVIFS